MTENRAPIIFALLMLSFFVSTSAGFASVSAVQEQLRSVQLKLIQEKIKLLQEGIINVGRQQAEEREVARGKTPSPLVASEPNREELEKTLKAQIATLQGVVAGLRPRAIEEDTARIEKRIGEIKDELKTAAGIGLRDLQDELNGLLAEYEALQEQVRQSLVESITYRQALVIGEQILAIQAKVQVLPRETPKPAVAGIQTPSEPAVNSAVKAVEAEVEKLRLKVLQAQTRAIQEKIDQLRGR